jgi:hypothetical protein
VRFTYANKVVPLRPATRRQIAAVEEHFGGKLPKDYVAFLESTNGGVPEPCFLPHRTHAFDIESLHGVGAATDIYDVLGASAWPSEVLGRHVVAIGGNGAGDQLVLLRPGDPKIYQWVHDEDIRPRRMADSFTAMLAKLRPVD